jgi:protein SCO1/2
LARKESGTIRTSYCLELGVVAIPLLFAGCQGNPSKGSAEKQYPVKGKVVAVHPDKQTVTLEHEDIPGLMHAMTMDFEVANSKLLDGLNPGDQLQDRLKVESGKYVITELEKR